MADYFVTDFAQQETRSILETPPAMVTIQITPESKPAIPSWMGEVAAFARVLTHTGMLQMIQDRVRFTRARFGRYDLIDFVVVLIGYVVSGEPTLLAFYERLAPCASPFMALFWRDRLPHRSTLSRFRAALDQSTEEALRTRFQVDVLARTPFPSPGGLFDRRGAQWLVIDVDGTRATARQRALPQMEDLPTPHRRFDQGCAPGFQGRKRGEVVRTRTVILQAHTHQLLGTHSILVRLDGLYGDAAPLLDVLSADLGVIARSLAYHLLDLEVVKHALARPPDQVSTHRSLPCLSFTGTVSRKQQYNQAAAGERGVLADRFLTSRPRQCACRITSCFCSLERLAPMRYPARMAEGGPQRSS